MAPKTDGLSGESSEESSHGSSNSRRLQKNTEEYRKRRERNNQAVKKSRLKTKKKTQEMVDRVTQLRTENEELEENIKILNKELGLLKNLFLEHAAMGDNTLSDLIEVMKGANSLLRGNCGEFGRFVIKSNQLKLIVDQPSNRWQSYHSKYPTDRATGGKGKRQ